MEKNEIIQQYKNFLKYFERRKLNDIKHIFNRRDGNRQHPFISKGRECMICEDINYTHINITLNEFFENNDIRPKKLSHKSVRVKIMSSVVHSDNEEFDYNDIVRRTDSDFTNKKKVLSSKLYKKNPYKISTNRSKVVNTNTQRQETHISLKVHNKITKNEYCDICFSDIKDKFSLSCNHFYCKSCLIDYVKNGMTNISNFKNLKCPKVI
jgi:hypothetical protein